MVETFRKYGLADRILDRRNFTEEMASDQVGAHAIHTVADLLRAVVVDYGIILDQTAKFSWTWRPSKESLGG
jgi:hypothetical protein